MKPQGVIIQMKATDQEYLHVEWCIVLSLLIDETQVSIYQYMKFSMQYVNVALFVTLYKEHRFNPLKLKLKPSSAQHFLHVVVLFNFSTTTQLFPSRSI